MKKIIFYSDVAEFGGHEVETLAAARYLCQQAELDVGFIFYEGNKRLSSRLLAIKEDGGRISLHPIKYYGKRLQSFRTLFSLRKITELKGLFKSIQPDRVIIASGNIETCTLGLVAAKKAGYQIVSYVAVAHKISVMGNKFGSAIRDALDDHYYSKLPDHYITISNWMKKKLIDRGVSAKISVVYNGLDLNKYIVHGKQRSRTQYGANGTKYLIGLVGRVHFPKGHDLLMRAFSQHREMLKDIRLLVVGDGPDLGRLKDMVNAHGLNDMVTFVPWTNDLTRLYSALDMLIIPSWSEGVPLVMLEAMYYSMPIVASNIDGMAEILPQAWLFKVGDRDSLVETLLAVKNGDHSEAIRKNKLLIEQEYNIDNFGAGFLKALSEGAG